MMFTKIDKKVLAILVIVLLVALAAGFFVFKYIANRMGAKIENSAGGASTENMEEKDNDSNLENDSQQNVPDIQLDLGGVQAEGGSGSGGLIICLDKCGDGVCQESDSDCPKGSMNCICEETPQECPQDCAQ